MSKLNVYAIRDNKTEAYMSPFFLQNDNVMKRALIGAKDDPNSMLAKHPEDYGVYSLGTYEQNSGVLDSHEPIHVINVIDLYGENNE